MTPSTGFAVIPGTIQRCVADPYIPAHYSIPTLSKPRPHGITLHSDTQAIQFEQPHGKTAILQQLSTDSTDLHPILHVH